MLAVLGGQDSKLSGNPQKGWLARCPAHDDRTPSFSLSEGNDGRALVYCHAGCTIDQIASALQMDIRELFEGEPIPLHKREVVATYLYRNAQGEVLFRVVRTIPKGFFQQQPDGHGGWINGRKGIPPVLYNLPAVLAAEKVMIVEGEKDADALISRGVVATTNPGGAGKWRDEYSPLFRGKKVWIIQHVDPLDLKTGHYPGQEHAQQVRRSLEAAGVKPTVLQPAAGCNDVYDHLAAGHNGSDLEPASDPHKLERLEIVDARDIMALPDPDKEGYLLGPMIYKGHRIVVGGWTGHGKTTFTMYMTAAACYGKEFLRPGWKGKPEGAKALVIDVEQGTRTVKRVLREVGLENSDRVKYLRVPDGLALDSDADA
ncbi:MAG: AAA family ATPase, partial [Acidimicrobiaceae bacterium]|nr:AAA family ATPase [Acidimicrobiaceae bacterium]